MELSSKSSIPRVLVASPQATHTLSLLFDSCIGDIKYFHQPWETRLNTAPSRNLSKRGPSSRHRVFIPSHNSWLTGIPCFLFLPLQILHRGVPYLKAMIIEPRWMDLVKKLLAQGATQRWLTCIQMVTSWNCLPAKTWQNMMNSSLWRLNDNLPWVAWFKNKS